MSAHHSKLTNTRGTRLALALLGTLIVGVATPLAHHAFSAEFDKNKPLKLSGTVSKVEWINPHSWIHIDVKDPKTGKVATWAIEGGTPQALLRRGVNRSSLPNGIALSVRGWAAKDGSNKLNGANITLADGKELFIGSSGTGAPEDPGKK